MNRNMTDSKPMTIVIVGGVAGGASVAARARRHSESARIVLIERTRDVSFANCGIPYHIGGDIKERASLALQTPQSLRDLLNIEVRTLTEAVAIDRTKKELRVRSLADASEDDVLAYDKLVLAPGASPLRPPLPGISSAAILTLRNLDDMDHIKAAAASVMHIAIIGGGFIGLEMAEQLHHLGKDVTVIEMQHQVLPQLDAEMVHSLENALRVRGVKLILGDGIDGFEEVHESASAAVAPDASAAATAPAAPFVAGSPNRHPGLVAKLKSGRRIEAGLVILSIGVRPENALAKEAGLELGPRGHIRVDAHQVTSDPSIYAVGDACETMDPILGKRAAIPLGGPANRQGRTAADHIFLGDKALRYPGSIGTAIVRVFDRAAGITGYSEARLKAEGVPYQTITVNGGSHASYYPGSETISLKILWAPEDGRILGAQASGKDGVDKRLDVIATAIRGRLTIDDLAHLELSYAPPFGNAKDVVNIAGFAAGNVRDGFLVPAASFAAAASGQILDVRSAETAAHDPVLGAVNIPLAELRGRLDELDRGTPVFTVCQMGKTSYFAERILANNGFEASSIVGGLFHQTRN